MGQIRGGAPFLHTLEGELEDMSRGTSQTHQEYKCRSKSVPSNLALKYHLNLRFAEVGEIQLAKVPEYQCRFRWRKP